MSSDPDELTPNQWRVLKYIKRQIEHKNHVPTIREIGDHLGIASPNGVAGLLNRIEAKGMIKRNKNRARSISLTEKSATIGLPMVGQVTAGPMTETFAQAERFDFNVLQGKSDFVLKVSGDSMIDAQIAPGDFVIVKRQNSARRGDIVVVCDDENETTLKYWYPEKNRVRLQPANKSMKPIYRKDVRVLGIVTGLVRKYSV
ncbi:MAG: transcriptional repressor LexA [Planctomycetota bacterium]